jgi:N-acetylglucosaminyldiphosphoundecaprenol N-acetyl-beta-D-mannosaminyltransferase
MIDCYAILRIGLTDKETSMGHIELLGIKIDSLTMNETIDQIIRWIEKGDFSYAVTPNVDHMMKLQRDKSLREIYSKARLVLADGVPLVWASAILGKPLKERVNGTDLFERLCEVAADRGYAVYLMGGNPGAAEAAAQVLKQRHQGLRIAGCDCPEYGFETSPNACKIVQERIALAKADILFVGLGAPKQERWIYKFGRESGVAFAVGIGISFSLVGGEIKRAPKWMQRAGFEWLWRLGAEPRRLWKRYILEDMPFVALIGREWMRLLLSRHTHFKYKPKVGVTAPPRTPPTLGPVEE